MTQNDALAAYLGPEIFERLDWAKLTHKQRDAILSVFRVGLGAGAQSGVVSTIDAVMAQHAVVRDLVGNGWMHLFWLEPQGPRRAQCWQGRWLEVEASQAA